MLSTVKGKLENLLGDFYAPVMILLKTLVVLIVAFALVKIGRIVIKKLFDKQKKLKYKIDDKRIDTISTLTISIFKYTVYIGALLTILSGILDLKAILAAAGVGGVALGFGAQSLVKDTISGFLYYLKISML